MSHFVFVFWNLVYFSVYWRQKQNAILDTNLPCILDSQWPFLTSANRTIGKFLDVHWLHRSGLKKYSKQKYHAFTWYFSKIIFDLWILGKKILKNFDKHSWKICWKLHVYVGHCQKVQILLNNRYVEHCNWIWLLKPTAN